MLRDNTKSSGEVLLPGNQIVIYIYKDIEREIYILINTYILYNIHTVYTYTYTYTYIYICTCIMYP